MSSAGSVRSGATPPYGPPSPVVGAGGPPPGTRKRKRIVRWEGLLPIALAIALFIAGWMLFAGAILRGTIAEAGSKALGTQLDIGDVAIRTFATTVELRGIALADPFNANRNLFEVGHLVVALEPKPLLQKKLVVRQLTIADVRTGTARATPAQPVAAGGEGFAPRAMAEVQRFVQQFRVPLLSLTPIDTLKALVLDPTQLRAVQATLALAERTDVAKQEVERGFTALRLQETVDSSAALLGRLQGTNARALGVQGARAAAADLRRAIARVDSARGRVDRLVTDVRRGVDTLTAGLRAVDDARRDDYAFARGLLQLPSVDAPDIGAALFGPVTIDKFQQAVYWATLARAYVPPGLLPRESPGPRRVRGAGTTVHFVTPESYPRFLLRRADVNVTMGGAGLVTTYRMAASDVTTDPAIVGRPTLFALRRASSGGAVDSVLVTGSMDHLSDRPKEVLSAVASGVLLPVMTVPSLPYRMNPGRGTSELRFALDGEQVSGRWSVRAAGLNWVADSARARPLNTIESLVARVLTGIRELEVTAEMSGTLSAPRLAVRSNLDRQVADRLRAVAGEEIAAAQRRARAHVDRLVDERSAPVKARIEELRADGDRRLAEARAKLDDEKRRLEERLRAFALAVLVG